MEIVEAHKNKPLRHIQISNNTYLEELNIPEKYWTFTLNMKKFNSTEKYKSENSFEELDEINESHKIIGLINSENVKHHKEEISTFLLPRKDWHITQGDYILPPPKSKSKKIFSRNDTRNLVDGLWYILLSLAVSYFILDLIFKTA